MRERPRRLASTGWSSGSRGTNTADPRAAVTATMMGGQASETATAFWGRGGATSVRGEPRATGLGLGWPSLSEINLNVVSSTFFERGLAKIRGI